jgi:hypothetical protein
MLTYNREKFSREETIDWLLSNTIVGYNGCLILKKDFWSVYTAGYPIISWNGKRLSICRFICFEPDEWRSNLVTRHRCHRKDCINPNHLMQGSNSDNIRDNSYAPFAMPEVYDEDGDEDNWWDDPPDEQLEKEYETYLGEMNEDYQDEHYNDGYYDEDNFWKFTI